MCRETVEPKERDEEGCVVTRSMGEGRGVPSTALFLVGLDLRELPLVPLPSLYQV